MLDYWPLFMLGLVGAQMYYPVEFIGQPRSGSCPPALPVAICDMKCETDSQCEGFYKCCPTACGGAVCSRPVTSLRTAQLKAGACPSVPGGRWVCSNTCRQDADCRGRAKCCPNRCGALACALPVDNYSNYPNV